VKLAIVCQRYDPSGVAGRFIARSLPALERAGVEVTLITREAQGWGARRVLRVDPFHVGRLWSERSFARAAREAWLREGFDLVQSHEPIPGCHVYRPGGEAHPPALVKETIEHPRLRAVLCPSKKMHDELRRAFRVAPEKLHVVYSGVDLEYFHPRERERLRGAARAELGCRPRDTVFLMAGRGSLDAAIDAARHESLWLAVADEKPRASGFPERVRFAGARADLRPLYAAADCLLELSEGAFAETVLEALAMGLPAIVSARNGASELIEPGVSGWLWQPDDRPELARLLSAADAAARNNLMEDAARTRAEQFEAGNMVERLSGLYRTLAVSEAG
jgi:UDP-glucose:(heptosyl)LPS alpha-1,3-glucosyltransferase